MDKKRTRTNDKRKKTTTEKGRVVERIVALLHKTPHVTIERNVRLTTKGKSKRKREIDVLLSTYIAGYPVQIAIECKNETNKIGSPKIDAFIGKLQDVGIPLTLGIYVSASGYTKGAIERADEVGIRPLELIGLSEDQLEAAIEDAFESIIYLVLKVNQISVFNKSQNIEERLSFYDAQKRICSTVPHLLWHMWLNNVIPSTLGEHMFLPLQIPQGWYRLVNGELSSESDVCAIVTVQAIVLTIKGKAVQFQLKNAATEQIERKHINVSFPKENKKYPAKIFDNEKDLKEHLHSKDGAKLTIGRLKMPRIITGTTYWPPSERATQKLLEYAQQNQKASFEEIEGDNLYTAWEEPAWVGVKYPIDVKETA